MKKYLIGFIIGGILSSVIAVKAAYVYTAKDIGYSPTDSNWEVGNAREALDSLKTDFNNVNTNVNEYKETIAEALANKGLEVTSTSTMEEIENSITNMGASEVYNLGSGTSFDIKTILPSKYGNLTNDNFVVFMSGTSTSGGATNDWRGETVSGSASSSCSKSYNATTGVFTASCSTSLSASCGNGRINKSASATPQVYLIMGDIK